jgi:FMN phosphatase YigB (HAD superfamily)
MKISTIFFDLGNVLVDFDFGPALENVSQHSSLTKEELFQIAVEDQALKDYELGKIESPALFTYLKNRLQFKGSSEELEFIWCDIFTPNKTNIEIAEKLSAYYSLAIISNTSDAHIRFLEKNFDFFRFFKEKIFSHQVGMIKPNPDIFQYALEKMNADKFESLFIDDMENNILTPAQMGWQTIHLRPEVSLQLALQSYDLEGVRALDI